MATTRKRKKAPSSGGLPDMAAVELAPEAAALLDLAPPTDKMLLVAQRGAGVWWALPLGRGAEWHNVSLAVTPGKPVSEWPLVLVKGLEATTIASRAANGIASLLFARMTQSDTAWGKAADAAAALKPAAWDSLRRLDEALGGPADFDTLVNLLAHDTLRAACTADNHAARGLAVVGILAALDPTEATQAYAAGVQAVIEGKDLPALPDAGCRTGSLATLVFRAAKARQRKKPNRALANDAAWAVATGSPGLDTATLGATSLLVAPRGPEPGRLVIEAAQHLVEERAQLSAERTGDPMWPVVERLAKSAGSLWDVYLEAAQALVAAKQPARAFVALQGAAFWYRVHQNGHLAETLEMARQIADAQRWTDVVAALDAMLDG